MTVAAACFKKPMICLSVYRFFMPIPLLGDGLYLNQPGPENGGQVRETQNRMPKRTPAM